MILHLDVVVHAGPLIPHHGLHISVHLAFLDEIATQITPGVPKCEW